MTATAHRRHQRPVKPKTALSLVTPKPIAAPTPDMPIREAGPSDADDVMALLRLMHGENGRGALNEDKVRVAVDRGVNRQAAVIGLIGDPGEPQATIGLFIDSFWYTNASHLADLWTFVHPNYRRGAHGRNLLGWAKIMSDQLGIPLGMGIMSIGRVWEKVRMYERQLGEPIGVAFWHDPREVTPCA